MKKILISACLWAWAGAMAIGQIAAWDFYGQSQPAACAATTFHPDLISTGGANQITRGPGAPPSAGVHSFRTTGFQNNGISVTNTDFFQVTLTAAPGYKLSLSTLDARFNGTSTFCAAPGVTSQFAYSLDGFTFILIGNPVQSPALTMSQIDLSTIPELQNVHASVTITLRYYASGQTNTGGWGFYSVSAGTNGFSIGGTVIPATITPPAIQASAITFNSIGVTQLSLSWTPGDGEKRIVKMNNDQNFSLPPDGEDPLADPHYAGTGEQVVYNGYENNINSITGLLPGNNYWFRVFEYNGAGSLTRYHTGTAPGNPNSATTSSTILPPEVTEPCVSVITTESAVLGGRITGNGGGAISARGTVWSLQSPVDVDDHPLAEGGIDTGIFAHQRAGLPPGTLIYYAAWASNQSGTSLSPEGMFYTLASEPSAHVATFTATGTGTTTVGLTWQPSVADSGGYLILQKCGSSPCAAVPSDAMEYSPDDVLGDAMVVADIRDRNACSGVAEGLQPGTAYSFSIFPYSWDGIHPATINYLCLPPVPFDSAVTTMPLPSTYQWTGMAGNNWGTPGSWSPERLIPAPNDHLIFDHAGNSIISGVPSQTIGQFHVISGTSITLQGNGTISIGGDCGIDLIVDYGCQLNLSGSGVILLSLDSNATAVINGQMTFSGGGHRLISTEPQGIVFQTGSQFKAGSGFSGNAFGTVNLGSVVFCDGSTYIAMAGGNPFGAPAPASVVIFQPGSLYRIDAYHVPSFGGRTYGNFEMNYPGMITATGNAAVCIDHFTASQGSFYFNVTGNPGHVIRGNLHVCAPATLFFSPSSTGTIHFSSNESQSVSGSGSIISGANSRIVIDNPSGVICQMDTELNDLIIGEGSFVDVLPEVTLTVEGDLITLAPSPGIK